MIIDTSAVMAIVLGEDDAGAFVDALEPGSRPLMSAGTWLEAAIVATRRSDDAEKGLRDALDWIMPDVVPVTLDQMLIAREAFLRFGKGRHKAALNYGDCFAYALAMERGEPLLFKGADFALTDVKRAL